MDLILSPEIERRIAEQIRLGRFPTPEAVVEAAVVEFTENAFDELLDAADIAAINEAEEQIERGEGIDLAELAAELAKRAPDERSLSPDHLAECRRRAHSNSRFYCETLSTKRHVFGLADHGISRALMRPAAPHQIGIAAGRAEAPVRSLTVRPYLIYFRAIDADKVVLILRIRHGARRRPPTI